jgi:hypothetical protein
LELDYLVEVTVNWEVGNFIDLVLFERVAIHSNAVRGDIQLFSALNDGLSVKGTYSFSTVVCVVVGHISNSSLGSQNFGFLCGGGSLGL